MSYQFQHPSLLVSIPLAEYDILQRCRQENYNLHQRLFQLTANYQTLQDTLKTRDEIILARDKTIDELKRENAELKLRITELEISNKKLTNKNEILGAKIENLENELITAKEELATTKEELVTTKEELATTKEELATTKEELKNNKEEITQLKNNKLFAKFIVSIQDLNSYEKLEKKLSNPKILYRLRMNRVSECHYLDEELDNNEKEIRRNLLIDKLNSADSNIVAKFNKLYPDLLEMLKPYLNKRDVQIDEEATIWANNWWEL